MNSVYNICNNQLSKIDGHAKIIVLDKLVNCKAQKCAED